METNDQQGERRSVLGRVNTILSAFDDSDQVLTLQDLTDRSALPKSNEAPPRKAPEVIPSTTWNS